MFRGSPERSGREVNHASSGLANRGYEQRRITWVPPNTFCQKGRGLITGVTVSVSGAGSGAAVPWCRGGRHQASFITPCYTLYAGVDVSERCGEADCGPVLGWRPEDEGMRCVMDTIGGPSALAEVLSAEMNGRPPGWLSWKWSVLRCWSKAVRSESHHLQRRQDQKGSRRGGRNHHLLPSVVHWDVHRPRRNPASGAAIPAHAQLLLPTYTA